MIPAEIEKILNDARSRIEPLERLIRLFADSLTPPIMYDSGKQHYGFRYCAPGLAHFCLLKAARAVSALNAMVELARSGYVQEVAVLSRVLIECTTHIDYVLAGESADGATRSKAQSYVSSYFSDFARNSREDFKRASVRQKQVHEVVGTRLERGSQTPNLDAEMLLSNVYLTFSNYVHAKYPEAMDMYGGNPGQFHVRGMTGTSKDEECVALIEAFEVTVALALVGMVQTLKLLPLIESDKMLNSWYQSLVS